MELIVNSLHDILTNIKSDCDFAAFGYLSRLPYPGLYIEGLGNIPLPVSQRDVEALLGRSKQSAFGFKSETRVDLNVRKTWEIQADQVRFDHPSWPGTLRQIVDHVSTILRVPRGVEAKLNKLLIYEKGGKFDKHKDSEKEDGMFGTLVITLPISHTGGDILLEHGGMKKVFQSAPMSTYGMSFMAWYADVSHQVCEVETGNRIVLTYNLIHARGVAGLSAEEQYNDLNVESDLHRLLNKMKLLPEAEKPLAYQLDHKYTEANMRLDHLKGVDRKRCELLYSAAKASDFSIFLASMEKSIYGGCEDEGEYDGYWSFDDDDSENEDSDGSDEDDFEGYRSSKNGPGPERPKTSKPDHDWDDEFHKILEVCDESVSLKTVFDLAGRELAKHVEIDESQVVQGEEAFRKIDAEDYSGWTGNEGVSATHYYRSTVLVLIPRIYEIKAFSESILSAGRIGIDSWIQKTIEEYRIAGPNQKGIISGNFEALIDLALRQFTFHPYAIAHHHDFTQKILSGSTLDLCAMAALAMDNQALLLRILCDCKHAQPSVWYMLGKVIRGDKAAFREINLCEILDNYDLQEVYDALAQLNNALEGNDISHKPTYDQRYDHLVYSYLEATMKQRLQGSYLPSKDDGRNLATLCSLFPNFVETTFLPFTLKHKSNSAFTMAFLAAAQREIRHCNLEDLKVKIMSVRGELINSLDIQGSYQLQEKTSTQFSSSIHHRPLAKKVTEVVPKEENISLYDLADVLLLCIQNDDETSAQKMTIQILEAARHAPVTIFRDLLLPLLEKFLPRLKAMITASHCSKPWDVVGFAKRFLHPLLELYMIRYVQEERAKQPPDWKRDRVTCGCDDCDELNRFLTSATQSMGRFRMGQQRRTHLEYRLRAYSEYMMDTERRGSPHTLVVRKGKDAATKAREAWMVRRKEAEELFQRLQRGGLSIVMGKEDVQAILRVGLLANKPLTKTNANQKAPVPLGPGAGSKHRLDQDDEDEPVVIDLT